MIPDMPLVGQQHLHQQQQQQERPVACPGQHNRATGEERREIGEDARRPEEEGEVLPWELEACTLDSHPGVLRETRKLLERLAERRSDAEAATVASGEAAATSLEREERADLLWVCRNSKVLALAPESCRPMQTLLEKLSSAQRGELVKELQKCTKELLESPNGNHVLSKAIVETTQPALGPFIGQLEQIGAHYVARHRFGCRILERLIESCKEEQMRNLYDEFVEKAESLSRHQYGNFVVQSLLEHGSERRKGELLEQLLSHIPHLATHRTGSHVVQEALQHSSSSGQRRIFEALLRAEAPRSLEEVAANRYGSYVAEELQKTLGHEAWAQELVQEAQSCLQEALPRTRLQQPQQQQFFLRVARSYGLLVSPEVVAEMAEETRARWQREEEEVERARKSEL